MNNEIKVILNYLDMYKNMNEGLLKSKDKKLLLDYITNLQQAIKDTKDSADDMLYELKQENETLKVNLQEANDNAEWWTNRFKAVQEQNKRLKEQINQYENPEDMTLFYMWLDVKAKDKMKQFENQIIMLKQQNQIITQLGENYKSRCEKTINILNNIFMLDNVTITNNACEEIDKAINTLQNGDDDNG